MSKTILSLALFGATALIANPVPAAAQHVKALCTENTRACLLKTTKVYVEGLGHHDPSRIPFSPAVRCTEQGNVPVTDDKTTKSTAIIGIRNLRLLADPTTKSVGAFFLIDIAGDKAKNTSDYTVRRGERFKIVDGLITEVEAFNYVDPDLHGLATPLWPN
jgi:hypothetical protein